MKMARELEKLDVYWLEEPLHHEALGDLARLTEEVDILIAGGEDEHGLHRFREFLDRGCFDVLQPDPAQSGGVLQCRKIAALAESKYKLFVPHTWGTGIKLAAGLQLAGSTPNCPFIECCIDMPAIDQIHDPLLKRPLEFRKDGCLVVPQEPGLGIEIDENAVSTFSRSRGHDH